MKKIISPGAQFLLLDHHKDKHTKWVPSSSSLDIAKCPFRMDLPGFTIGYANLVALNGAFKGYTGMYREEQGFECMFWIVFWGGTWLLKVKYVILSERLLANVQFGNIIEIRLLQYIHVISSWARDYPLNTWSLPGSIVTYLDHWSSIKMNTIRIIILL